MFVLPKSFGY